MKNKLKISFGDRYGKLIVVKELSPFILPSGQKNRKFLCKCDCGKLTEVRLMHISRGKIKSCGCLSGEKHNLSNSKIYNKWRAMMTRTSKNGIDSHRYYDRGITVCNEWQNSFTAFYEWALNNGYKDQLQLDRIDNNKGYYPENCRFVSNIENLKNREITKHIIYKGLDYVYMDLIRTKGLVKHENTIKNRIARGWTIEDAFDKPIRQGNYK